MGPGKVNAKIRKALSRYLEPGLYFTVTVLYSFFVASPRCRALECSAMP